MKIGINLVAPIWYGASWIFNDLMDSCGTGGGGTWNLGTAAAQTDLQNYPILQNKQSAFTRIYSELQGNYPGGLYMCTYDGEGTLEFDNDASVEATLFQSYLLMVNPTNNGIMLKITSSNPNNPIKNIKVTPISDTSVGRFNTKYINDLLPFEGPLRFVAWVDTNIAPTSGLMRWCDRSTPYVCSQAHPNVAVKDEVGNHLSDPVTGRQYYSAGGVCIEYQVDLCNKLNRDGWFNIPHTYTNDHIRGMAIYVKNNLASGLRCYWEYSNEVWNWNYPVTTECYNLGLAAGDLHGATMMTGKVLELLRVFSVLDQVFAGDPRCKKVLADQFGLTTRFDSLMTRLHASGYTGVDAFSAACYFYVPNAIKNTYTTNTPVSQIISDCSDFISSRIIPGLSGINVVRNKWQTALNRPIELVAYEWGNELIPGLNQPYTQPYYEAQSDPGMSGLYTQVMQAMSDAGMSFACLCTDVTPYSQYGCYGIRQYQNSPKTDPKPASVFSWSQS